jgi:hypothetical protein
MLKVKGYKGGYSKSVTCLEMAYRGLQAKERA